MGMRPSLEQRRVFKSRRRRHLLRSFSFQDLLCSAFISEELRRACDLCLSGCISCVAIRTLFFSASQYLEELLRACALRLSNEEFLSQDAGCISCVAFQFMICFVVHLSTENFNFMCRSPACRRKKYSNKKGA